MASLLEAVPHEAYVAWWQGGEPFAWSSPTSWLSYLLGFLLQSLPNWLGLPAEAVQPSCLLRLLALLWTALHALMLATVLWRVLVGKIPFYYTRLHAAKKNVR